MAKLSELVAFKDQLTKIVAQLSLKDAIMEKASILQAITTDTNVDECNNDIDQIVTQYHQLVTESNAIVESVDKLIIGVNQSIDHAAADLMKSREHVRELPLQNLKKRMIPDTVIPRIQAYANWHYPGLYMYPSNKHSIDQVVACDPLYLVGSEKILKSIISDYSEIYQKRLRLYDNLDQLPSNQFGFILIWDIFVHLPFSKFKENLTKIFELLRPGGTTLVSYNNCDIFSIAKISENRHIPYASFRKLKELTDQIGFELVYSCNAGEHHEIVSWVELRKPGQLTTVKAHQAMAEIIVK
jgi:hypothetical protein